MGAKKRSYKSFSGRRENSGFGPIHETNVQVNELPPVGSRVIVMEEYTFRDNRSYNGIQSFYRPCISPAYTDAYGNLYVFEVEGYSRGIESVFDTTNKVHLRHYYGADKSRGSMRVDVRAIDVVIGVMRLDCVSSASSTVNPAAFNDHEQYCSRKGVFSDE